MPDRTPDGTVLFVEADGSRWIAPDFAGRKADREAFGHMVGVDEEEYGSLLEAAEEEGGDSDPQEGAEFKDGSHVFTLLVSPEGERLGAVLIVESGEHFEQFHYPDGSHPESRPFEGPEVIGLRLSVGSRHDAEFLAATPLDPDEIHTTHEEGNEFRVDGMGRLHHAFGPALYGDGERTYVLHGVYLDGEEYARRAVACAVRDGEIAGCRPMSEIEADWLRFRVEHEMEALSATWSVVGPGIEAALGAATVDNVEEISRALADSQVDFDALAVERGWISPIPARP